MRQRRRRRGGRRRGRCWGGGAHPVSSAPRRGGVRGRCELATMPEADLVLIGLVGAAGLRPALAAIEAGKDIAVASKEILVMAGGGGRGGGRGERGGGGPGGRG